MKGAINAYESDAHRERSSMWISRITAIALGLASTTLLVVGAERSRIDGPMPKVSWSALTPYLLAVIPILAAGVFAARTGSRHRLAGLEASRVMRQLASIGPYLEPLPPTARGLLRASMMPRIFPRAVELDPMFESDAMLPEPTDILMAIDPDSYRDGSDDAEG
jgi:hypothetical protein